jgi:hypothetical protein
LIDKYMSLPNEIWDSIIQRATAVSEPGSRVTPWPTELTYMHTILVHHHTLALLI